MRLLQALQAAFLVADYAVATYIPGSVSSAELYGRQAKGLDLAVKMPPDYKVRDIWGSKCKCKKECPKDQIKDKDNCEKCQTCPQLRKPNKAQDTCIRDKDEKKRLFEKTKKSKAKIHVPKGPSWNEKIGEQKERFLQKKKNRISQCLVLTPLSISLDDSAEYDELWDEEWLDEGDYLDLWPSDLDSNYYVKNITDDRYSNDSYIDQWLLTGINEECFGEGKELYVKGCLANHQAVLDEIVDEETKKKLDDIIGPRGLESNGLEARWAGPLVQAFSAAFRTASAIGARIGAVVGRAGGQLSRSAVRVVKNTNGKSPKQKMKGAQNLVKNHPTRWKRCLKGDLPY